MLPTLHDKEDGAVNKPEFCKNEDNDDCTEERADAENGTQLLLPEGQSDDFWQGTRKSWHAVPEHEMETNGSAAPPKADDGIAEEAEEGHCVTVSCSVIA